VIRGACLYTPMRQAAVSQIREDQGPAIAFADLDFMYSLSLNGARGRAKPGKPTSADALSQPLIGGQSFNIIYAYLYSYLRG